MATFTFGFRAVNDNQRRGLTSCLRPRQVRRTAHQVFFDRQMYAWLRGEANKVNLTVGTVFICVIVGILFFSFSSPKRYSYESENAPKIVEIPSGDPLRRGLVRFLVLPLVGAITSPRVRDNISIYTLIRTILFRFFGIT